jgi:hypothetical protein
MTSRLENQIKEALCDTAIEEFKELSSVPAWLNRHSELFDSISIKPDGLPRITLSHLGDETFENIQRFARLFEIVVSLYK